MHLTKTTCRYCRRGGVYGGPYAPRPARCGTCEGTGYVYESDDGDVYPVGERMATDGEEHFDPDDCGMEGDDGIGPDGQHVWMTELE